MSKSQRAFEKLADLAQPDTFRKQFLLIGEGASPTSCAQNAMVIVKYLTNQPMGGFMTGIKQWAPGGMSSVLSKTVASRMNEAILMYFELKFVGAEGKGGGDHHFCAFSLNSSEVVVAMGWQDLFTFEDWFAENNRGIYKSAVFLEHLRGIEAGQIKSVIDLCAYLGVVASGKFKGQSIIPALTSNIAGFKPQIRSSFYLDLP